VIPSILHNGNVQTITMRACKEYMISTAWDDIPGLLSDLTAFMASENEIRNLFQGRSTDIWEMANALSRFGPEYILVRMENGGQYLYDGVSKKRWMLPMYPINIVDPTGGADAFAGGFLATLRQKYDPLWAALCGIITESFAVEGCGAFYSLGALPGLKEARLEALKDRITQI
ncbi:MAG: carbohydrate kinase family protein, partial [Anaerolineaceae bacterium]|nr:carbohydrate kinase family protein [Anaerolineaceae bacterium]